MRRQIVTKMTDEGIRVVGPIAAKARRERVKRKEKRTTGKRQQEINEGG